ncbi:hypothetical protein H072_70 [Dactylellina haptotyla CBS 200.50]|uniref:Uncharacterized protein n=1 Tax=Dactylellina haptotyla (strain CBS 200.50) TaxID=1284197 RepID=S8ASS1_DACHA|nr:hypothetical protein H072_70 [Dactylellina haptotyla CBS 200.50]
MLSKYTRTAPVLLAIISKLGSSQLIIPDVAASSDITTKALVFYFSDGTAYEYTDYAYGWNGNCNKLNSPSPGQATVDFVEYVPQASVVPGAFSKQAADPDSGRSQDLDLRKLVIYRDLHCADEIVEVAQQQQGEDGGGVSESVELLQPVELDVEAKVKENQTNGGDNQQVDSNRIFLNDQDLGVDAPASFRLVLGKKTTAPATVFTDNQATGNIPDEAATDEGTATGEAESNSDTGEVTEEVDVSEEANWDENGDTAVQVEETDTISEEPVGETPPEVTPPPDAAENVVTVTTHMTITPSQASLPEPTSAEWTEVATMAPEPTTTEATTSDESTSMEATSMEATSTEATTTEDTTTETTSTEAPTLKVTPTVPGLTFEPDSDICDPKQPDSKCYVECDVEDPFCCHPTDRDYPDCCDPNDSSCWRHEFITDKPQESATPSETTTAESSEPAPEPTPETSEPAAESEPAPEETAEAASDTPQEEAPPSEQTDSPNPESSEAPPQPAKRSLRPSGARYNRKLT